MKNFALNIIIPQLISQGWSPKSINKIFDQPINFPSDRVVPLRHRFSKLHEYNKRIYIKKFLLSLEKGRYDKLFRRYLNPISFDVKQLPRRHQVAYLNFLSQHGKYIPFSYINSSNRVNLSTLTYKGNSIKNGFSVAPFFPALNKYIIAYQPGYVIDLIDFFSFGYFYFPHCNLPVGIHVKVAGPYLVASSEKTPIKQVFKNYFQFDFNFYSSNSAYNYKNLFQD